jgi:hypothetical protein
MKKTLLLLSVLMVAFVSFAQDLYFADANGNQIQGDLNISWNYDNSATSINPYDHGLISVISKASTDLKTAIRREIIGGEYVDGVNDEICWAACQPFGKSDVYAVSAYTTTLTAGSTTSLNGPQIFHYNFKDDDGNVHYGKTVLKYTILSIDGTDTTSYDDITISYELLHPAGVSDSKVSELNVYPNPVNGNSVTVKLNSDVDANSMVVIRDVIGKQVAVYNVNNIGGEMNLNVSNLNNGMFFVNVESNNAIISSSKLLINK